MTVNRYWAGPINLNGWHILFQSEDDLVVQITVINASPRPVHISIAVSDSTSIEYHDITHYRSCIEQESSRPFSLMIPEGMFVALAVEGEGIFANVVGHKYR